MFGAICAGRPVQTNLQQVDETKFVFLIEDGARVNHIVVFLLPGTVLDPSVAASVYFQWPGKPFQLLGAITNSKPSAIFRVNQSSSSTTSTATTSIDDMVDDIPSIEQITISLGISIEPAAQVEAQVNELRAKTNGNTTALVTRTQQKSPVDPNSTAALANKIMSHAFNFLSGFATPDGMVSLKSFNDWWQKFQVKLGRDPNFLDRLEE
ncbi:hypothetical protein POJ06DRAFT_271924 [Lipomyces tetrasporus]|uniref:Hikeshi-like domain-containing protein n=1 Tax=Lipomyces tetrasporus TaxID=54092 RepID=A0AAD7VNW3_9ASCO|nr:uncharacterized protein POJ06DRAFT_271924 [Lipomyces tetrasporus]KAJ8096907.1 hypothetical protein POJ06DRAFT_271924 [Lipomyces tetrasporus]